MFSQLSLYLIKVSKDKSSSAGDFSVIYYCHYTIVLVVNLLQCLTYSFKMEVFERKTHNTKKNPLFPTFSVSLGHTPQGSGGTAVIGRVGHVSRLALWVSLSGCIHSVAVLHFPFTQCWHVFTSHLTAERSLSPEHGSALQVVLPQILSVLSPALFPAGCLCL